MTPAERTLASARDIARALGDEERAERYQRQLGEITGTSRLRLASNAERDQRDDTADTHPGRTT